MREGRRGREIRGREVRRKGGEREEKVNEMREMGSKSSRVSRTTVKVSRGSAYTHLHSLVQDSNVDLCLSSLA